MNIYVGNIAKEVTDIELQDLFAAYGTVRSAKIIRDLFSGESKGFGFIEMAGNTEAQTAMNELNAKEFKGKNLIVNEARQKTDRKGGGNRRGGGGKGAPRGNSGGRRSW
ncbi:MAG TPA: RNA-binding protein [Ignavibacteriaceae bacterium]|jgi:RNA recognition motif-containing protein|nr:RNA-binding protein [Ignavibacteriaceae bacterium]